MPAGIVCSVYRTNRYRGQTGWDLHTNRYSDFVDSVTLCGRGIPEESEADEDCPVLWLLERVHADGKSIQYASPCSFRTYQASGNYLERKIATWPYAVMIPIHDHYEGNNPPPDLAGSDADLERAERHVVYLAAYLHRHGRLAGSSLLAKVE